MIQSSRLKGMLLSLLILVPFSRLRVDGTIMELPGDIQFLVVFSGLLGLTGWHILRHGFVIPGHNGLGMMLTWILLVAVSTGLSDMPFLALKRGIITAGPALLVYLLVYDPKQDHMALISGMIQGLGIVIAISALWALIGLAGFWHSPYWARLSGWEILGTTFSQSTGQRIFTLFGSDWLWMRLAGFFPNPNGLGIISVMVLTLAGFVEAPWRKWLIMAMVAGILVTLSRTALMLAAVSGLWLWLYPWARLRNLFAGAVVIGVLSLPFLVSGPVTALLESLLQMAGLSGQEALQLRERGESLFIAWNALPDYWLTGAGFGLGTEVLFDGAADFALHSVFFNAWIETGIMGMLALVALWVYPVWQAREAMVPTFLERMQEPRIVLSAILLGLFAAQAFDLSVTRFHYVHLLFFVFLGLLTAFNRQAAGKDHA